MEYIVIEKFLDLQDGSYRYKVGDTFPRSGLNVSDERLDELSSTQNKLNKPLIEQADAPINLDKLSLDKLKEYAAEKEIELPENLSKKKDILLFLRGETE